MKKEFGTWACGVSEMEMRRCTPSMSMVALVPSMATMDPGMARHIDCPFGRDSGWELVLVDGTAAFARGQMRGWFDAVEACAQKMGCALHRPAAYRPNDTACCLSTCA